ncbi:Alpha-type protein kinase domain-containing protein [Mycena kentingensis (nom. inval.)]|nr:Alpha-type protein kinase domain-containing protein [Mycena kentingensis (nom. inval.)]
MTNPSPECPSCGNIFPLRTYDGDCIKCERLAPHAIDSAEYREIEQHKQCEFCGITRRNNMPVVAGHQTCGTRICLEEARKTTSGGLEIINGGGGGVGSAVPETYAARAQKMAERLRLSHGGGSGKPGTALNTAALVHYEGSAGGTQEEKLRVAIQTCLSDAKAPNTKIGHTVKYLGYIIQELLDVVSPQFIANKLGPMPLKLNEVSLRWAGNRLPEPNSLTGNLGNFFKMHSSSTEKLATYIENIPTSFGKLAKGHNSKLIALDFVVNMDLYRERIERSAEDKDAGQTTSRKRTISGPGNIPLNKRPRGLNTTNIGSLLGSRFGTNVHTASPLTPRTQSKVTLERFNVSVDPATLAPEMVKVPEPVDALIFDEHFAKGASKIAFDMVLLEGGKEERVVAKRIYRMTDDDTDLIGNVISLRANRTLLEAECVRLKVGEKFWVDFANYTKEMEVPIFAHIKFASAYLATEMPVQITRTPSPASKLEAFDDKFHGMTWMIEPKRATAVLQFTATLDHKARGTDLQTETIHAFAHYVFGVSSGGLVLADLQGTPALVRGYDGIVLFDPMIHTTEGGSGLGDFGLEGIESFVDTHRCNWICEKLDFGAVFPLELPVEIPGPDGPDDSSEGGSGFATGGEDRDDDEN